MPEEKRKVVVSAGVIYHQGKILIAQRRLDKSLGGYWEFPGGKIESGETGEQALAREIKEEFDIDIQVEKFLTKTFYEYPTFCLTMFVYQARWGGQGQIKICDHEQYKWADLSELKTMDFPPADIPVLDFLTHAV